MNHRFDPNKNPIADDLLRLCLAPATRFSRSERRSIGRILAGKLYDIQFYARGFLPWAWAEERIYEHAGSPVVIEVVFDGDPPDELWFSSLAGVRENWLLIVLSVGSHGVVELYNGPLGSDAPRTVMEQLRGRKDIRSGYVAEGSRVIPGRSDEAVSQDYLGIAEGALDPELVNGKGGDRGDGRGGQDGGGGQGGRGAGPSGGDGRPGRGGASELLNHPILFSVERRTLDAILERT